ncbi:CsxC family protein [Anaerophilus nitritogenes]|uniref:CsxC family protein n=1 Tax=Anaerophilus nitritogenes TaxID=2498136 RepID=UPI001FAA30F7|nr:hypothetical protein [Anaerophilus nitritogenes]
MAWNKYNSIQNLQKNQVQVKECTSSCVEVSSGTSEECVNRPVDIESLRTGSIAKIPIVLAELTVKVNVDSIITLPEIAWEIKRIKKHVKITQCLLLQDTNILFIKGFVRKNIEYATRKCSNEEGFCGDIKHCTIDVPFSCTTPISFNGIEPLPPKFNRATEFEYFREEALNHDGFGSKDKLLSGDFREFNQISEEHFNELPFCELIKARIVEFDEILNYTDCNKQKMPFEERAFRKIEEKMVLFITLKILQKRQVAIGAVEAIPDCPCCPCDC